MICYRDQSFCIQAVTGVCANRGCDRYIAPDHDTGGLPVSLADFKREGCGYIENPIMRSLNVITGGGE